MTPSSASSHHEISLGMEVETYTINLEDYRIGRYLMFPRKGVVERDESYHRDRSIGIEYASRPYRTIREALFGVKVGLRKSTVNFKLERDRRPRPYALFFAGTWRDRFAASHFHVGLGPGGIEFDDAQELTRHLHGHLPFLIALLANSPVSKERITNIDSNRFLYADERFFFPLAPGDLDVEMREEITYNLSRKKRTPTLELRPCDANLPEYMAAGLVVVKAVTMAWLAGWPVANENNYHHHLLGRTSAGRRGFRARLYWNERPLLARDYIDRFFKTYHPFLSRMDIPAEVVDVFKLFKQGWNGAKILRHACRRHYRAHPRVWPRYFAENYAEAINALLNGENLYTFSSILGVRPPRDASVRLGSKKW